ELSLIQIPINHQNINIKQVSDMGVNDFYVLGSKTDSSFLYRKLPSGDLQELFSINYRVNEGLIIQNDHYVCFSINNTMFFFKKQSGQIVEINNNFLNSIHSLYFSSEHKIIMINH